MSLCTGEWLVADACAYGPSSNAILTITDNNNLTRVAQAVVCTTFSTGQLYFYNPGTVATSACLS